MDSIIYNALSQYYAALCKLGYYSYENVYGLLVLCFYRDFVYNDYRGRLSRKNYSLIEKALTCLFGSSCLIPYPDYLKMGKLHIGEITEWSQRISDIENTEVLKAFNSDVENDSDIIILSPEED